MQATLYAQIRTLIADVKSRYEDVEISVQSPLYPWLLRHAQLLINRYLQKSDGLNACERRWNRKYHGSICSFGETLVFLVANVERTQLSWRDGSGLHAIRSPTCTLSLIPPAFSRPGASGGTFRQDSRAWDFCKASQPHHGIPLVPYFHFPRMILSHCLRERPRKTLLPKSLWTST